MLFFKSNKSKKDKVGEKSSELFTYFIPAPPTRNFGYREKDFDSICALIYSFDLNLKILKTVNHENGFWVIMNISGKDCQIKALFADQRMSDHKISLEDLDNDEGLIIERE